MGVDVVVENPCDPWGRAHNYGLFWLNIGKLGLTRDDITWLAMTINAVFLILAIVIISPASVMQLIFALLFLVSPAVMLGLERTNADLIIFTLLVLSFYCLYSDNVILTVLGCLIIFFTAILKLYPVVILPVLIFYSSANKTKFSLLVATTILFFLYMFLNWSDVSHLIGVIPNITWHYSMGGELLFSRLGYELNGSTRVATYALAAMAVLSGIILGSRLHVSGNRSGSPDVDYDWHRMLYLSGSVLVVFSFVIKNSFDYRNIFFIFLLPYLLSLISRPGMVHYRKQVALVILMVYGFLFWAEFFVSVFHNVAYSASLIRIVESVLNWMIIVPIVILAMQIAITNAQSSWLMRAVVHPLQKLSGRNPCGANHE